MAPKRIDSLELDEYNEEEMARHSVTVREVLRTDRTVSQIARLAIRGFLAAAETKSEELPEMTFAADPEGRGFVVRAIASSPATEGARAHTEEVPSDS